MQRWIAALWSVLIGASIVLAAACGGGGATKAVSGTPVPPGWNKNASSKGLTLTLDDLSGPINSAVHIRGWVSPQLAHGRDKVSVQFWPQGAFRTLRKDEESKYRGDIWDPTARPTAYIGPDGNFEGLMPVPPAIKVGDEIRLVLPGQYWFALILDDQHATFAPFEVTPAQPLPTVSPAPYLRLGSFQFLDSKTGWLSTNSCRNQPRATPDEYGNMPTQPPAVCKGGFYGTTDGGQTWILLSHDGVGPFRFDSPQFGLAVNSSTYCLHSPCPSTVVLTANGGRQWTTVYETFDRLSDLSIVGGEAWLLSNSCGYDDRSPCTWHLLKSTDAGVHWSQTALPVESVRGVSMARPMAGDAWIATGDGRAGGQLLVTHDDAATWQTLSSSPVSREGGTIFFRTAQQGWLLIGDGPGAGSQLKELFGTSDGGAAWIHVAGSLVTPDTDSLGTAGYVGPLVFTTSQEGWIALSRRGLIHSTDAGVHWAYVNVDQSAGEVQPVVQFTDPLHGWTVSNYYEGLQLQQALWATSDGGATWQKLPLPATERPSGQS